MLFCRPVWQGCKDIDDALHCVPLPNGNFNVGVHIADVTYFVEAGSALDEEAANRSTRSAGFGSGCLPYTICAVSMRVCGH